MISYIILAHRNPVQVKRLVSRLQNQNSHFYIHIDKKVDIKPFKDALSILDNVHFLKEEDRCIGIWGDISLVKMTLNAMKQIIADDRSGYCVLLSGQDYPLRSSDFIESYLNKKGERNFINLGPLPYKGWSNNGMDRLEYYKINVSAEKNNNSILLPTFYSRNFYRTAIFKQVLNLWKAGKFRETLKVFIPRKFPPYLKPFGGDAWFALPIKTVKDIFKFLDQHPDFIDYNKHTLLPDEMFFHSIIMHIGGQSAIDHSLTYIKWQGENSNSPRLFISNDFDDLQSASEHYLFARKLDMDLDEALFDKIDNILLATCN